MSRGRVEVEAFDDGGYHTRHQEGLDMTHPTFDSPDLSCFTGLRRLGVEVTGQRLSAERAVLEARMSDPDP